MLTREAREPCSHPFYPVERVNAMNTYEEFMVILTVALLIVAILNYRKQASRLVSWPE